MVQLLVIVAAVLAASLASEQKSPISLKSSKIVFRTEKINETLDKLSETANITTPIDSNSTNIDAKIDQSAAKSEQNVSKFIENVISNEFFNGSKTSGEHKSNDTTSIETTNSTSIDTTSQLNTSVDNKNQSSNGTSIVNSNSIESNATESKGTTSVEERHLESNGTETPNLTNSTADQTNQTSGNISNSISELPITAKPNQTDITGATSVPILELNTTGEVVPKQNVSEAENKTESSGNQTEPTNNQTKIDTAGNTTNLVTSTNETKTDSTATGNKTELVSNTTTESPPTADKNSSVVTTTDSIQNATESHNQTGKSEKSEPAKTTQLPFGSEEPKLPTVATTNATEVATTASNAEPSKTTETPISTVDKTQFITDASNCSILRGVSKKCMNDGQCYKHSDKQSYCICKDKFAGENCQIPKSGHLGSKKKVEDLQTYSDTKLVNKKFQDGSTWARHFAQTVAECANLCQISGRSCKSFNFGKENGVQICELLQIKVKSTDKLFKGWIEPGHSDWSYHCCFD